MRAESYTVGVDDSDLGHIEIGWKVPDEQGFSAKLTLQQAAKFGKASTRRLRSRVPIARLSTRVSSIALKWPPMSWNHSQMRSSAF